MLERSPYPLLTLKILGSICPCLEKEDDSAARRAAWYFSSVHVRWHRRSSSSSTNDDGENNSGNAMSFIKGMFSGSGGSGGGSFESIDGSTISVIDARGGPQLIMSPPHERAIGKTRVPLRMIKTVRLAAENNGIEVVLDSNDVVLRFDVLKPLEFSLDVDDEEDESPPQQHIEDADDSTRNDTMVQLQILVEWESQRQARLLTLGIAEDESSEDVDGLEEGGQSTKRGGILADKARKVQHFAQREIEMKKQKRDREARKAKYVQGAGGLKYTAIAMANRS